MRSLRLKFQNRFISPPLDELETLRTPLNRGEKAALDFFHRNLEIEWEIYIQPHLNGLRPDFVLLNPNIGIAVFEIKDWNLDALPYRVEYSNTGKAELWATSKDGQDFPIKDNPVDKVMLYKQSLASLYCPSIDFLNSQLNGNYYNLITAGVIFTGERTQRVKNLLEPFRKAYGILGQLEQYHPISGIELLESDNLEAVFPSAKLKTFELMQTEMAQDLRSWLVEPDFAATQRQPLILNNKQREIATTRTKTGFRRIKGAAGSGKSLALAAKAAQLSIGHKDTLVITYNITLCHYLRDLSVRYPKPGGSINKYITWLHFHQWCKQLICREAGLTNEYNALWRGGSNVDSVLETELVDLVNKAIDTLGNNITKYDAIIVDEGQDYNQYWWETLRKILKPNGEMLLAADTTQDIYERAKNWTEERMKQSGFTGRWFELDVSYRMPPKLIEYLRNFVNKYLLDLEESLPEEENSEFDKWPVHLRWVQTDEPIAEKCTQAVLDMPTLASPKIVAYSDIVLLVPTHKIGLECVAKLESKNVQVVHVFGENQAKQRSRKLAFFMGNARVKACTIHSFKGWESRYLVVVITEDSDLAATYVALSRLKRHKEGSYLTVICSSSKLKAFGESWPIFIDS